MRRAKSSETWRVEVGAASEVRRVGPYNESTIDLNRDVLVRLRRNGKVVHVGHVKVTDSEFSQTLAELRGEAEEKAADLNAAQGAYA